MIIFSALMAEFVRIQSDDSLTEIKPPQLVKVPTLKELLAATSLRLVIGNFPTGACLDETDGDGNPTSQLDLESKTTNMTLKALRVFVGAMGDDAYYIAINRLPTKPKGSGNHESPPQWLFDAFERVLAPFLRRLVDAGARQVIAIAPSALAFARRCLEGAGYSFATLHSIGPATVQRGTRTVSAQPLKKRSKRGARPMVSIDEGTLAAR